jgi:hypothetical protein
MPMHENRLDIPLILSRLPLFQKLAPEQLAAGRIGYTRERRLAKGEVLVHKRRLAGKGVFCRRLRPDQAGLSSSQGNEKVVEILGPHQSFGEAVMFMDRPYPVFAEGLEESLLLHIGQRAGVRTPRTRRHLFARTHAGRDCRCACIPWSRTWKPTPCAPSHATRGRLPAAALPANDGTLRRLVRTFRCRRRSR